MGRPVAGNEIGEGDLGLACRICDRKIIHRNILVPQMDEATYIVQWDINEEEHVLFGTKKDIAQKEEDIETFDDN